MRRLVGFVLLLSACGGSPELTEQDQKERENARKEIRANCLRTTSGVDCTQYSRIIVVIKYPEME